MAEIKDNMNTNGGISMSMGGASEIDVSTGGGDVIDPRALASQISEQEPDDLSDTSIEGDTSIPTEADELQIITDDTTTTDSADTEDEKPAKEEKAKPAPSTVDNEETETFKVLGSYFHEEGILEGYEEGMENTPEAFESMITKTVEKQVEEYKNSFENPLSKQFLDFIEDGGDPGSFMQLVSGPDYSQVTTDAVGDNEGVQKQILRAYYTEQGEDSADIEDTIQAFEDSGHLEKKAQTALGKLQTLQDTKRKEGLQAQRDAKADQATKIQEYIGTLKTDIQGRDEIAGFNLSKKGKSDFFDYITKADSKTGQTKLHMDSQDPEKQLKMSFFYYNNFKFDKLEKQVKSKTTKNLAEMLGRHTDPSQKQTTRKQTPAQESGANNFGAMKKLFG
tara:strand:- start:12910 stop:14085 length:1176 start_codon:yes stop_codon:yes gene_type:complete